MITDRSILNIFMEFRQKVNLYGDYKQHLEELPDELREILQTTNKLLPLHCSASVIRELYIERLTAIVPSFTVDEYCSPVIELISQRIAQSGEFEAQSPTYGLDKGIILQGGIGSGKTLLMRGLIELCYFFDIELRIIPTYTIVEEFATHGLQVFGKRLYYKSRDLQLTRDPLILDDMGAEAVSTHYGQVTNVITELLLRRYDEAGITLGTTNLDQKILHRFYGDRVWSRMKSMFNFIELKGNDRRK